MVNPITLQTACFIGGSIGGEGVNFGFPPLHNRSAAGNQSIFRRQALAVIRGQRGKRSPHDRGSQPSGICSIVGQRNAYELT
jgi:hypothetical protein